MITLETDLGYFIARDSNGPVYIWDNLLDAHYDLKEMGFDGIKIIFIAEKLLTLCNSGVTFDNEITLKGKKK